MRRVAYLEFAIRNFWWAKYSGKPNLFHIIGINPEKCEDHEVYIKKLCTDYEEAIKTMFDSARAMDGKDMQR